MQKKSNFFLQWGPTKCFFRPSCGSRRPWSSVRKPQICILLQDALLFYCTLYTDWLGCMTDAVARHVNFSQITCVFLPSADRESCCSLRTLPRKRARTESAVFSPSVCCLSVYVSITLVGLLGQLLAIGFSLLGFFQIANLVLENISKFGRSHQQFSCIGFYAIRAGDRNVF